VDRQADRIVAVAAIVIGLVFLVTAVVVPFLPAAGGSGLWLPIHLALAGAATTVIAGVMPFFSAAIGTTQPVDARLRWASLVLVASGAAVVTYGFGSGRLSLAALGGAAFVVGCIIVGYATLAPWRRGLGPRGGVVALGYGAAVAMVVLGAVLATLYLAGWAPVQEAWVRLKPAHAWLNLIGFVSLIIATTMLHFFPTVVGARIQRVPSAYVTVAGLAGGAFVVALGFGFDSDIVVRTGALLVAAGALGLTLYAGRVWWARNPWHTDHAWHRFAMGGLVSAIAWFDLGVATAVVRLLFDGAAPGAVDASLLTGPLVAGWLGLAVLASATHLIPAVGPGDASAHARQRTLLGRWALVRLAGLDGGVAALSLGLAFGIEALAVVGAVLLASALLVSAGLLVMAVALGLRGERVP
jgi:nitrite reductase (NO-forming)